MIALVFYTFFFFYFPRQGFNIGFECVPQALLTIALMIETSFSIRFFFVLMLIMYHKVGEIIPCRWQPFKKRPLDPPGSSPLLLLCRYYFLSVRVGPRSVGSGQQHFSPICRFLLRTSGICHTSRGPQPKVSLLEGRQKTPNEKATFIPAWRSRSLGTRAGERTEQSRVYLWSYNLRNLGIARLLRSRVRGSRTSRWGHGNAGETLPVCRLTCLRSNVTGQKSEYHRAIE